MISCSARRAKGKVPVGPPGGEYDSPRFKLSNGLRMQGSEDGFKYLTQVICATACWIFAFRY